MIASWFLILIVIGGGVLLTAGICGAVACKKKPSKTSNAGGSGIGLGIAGLIAIAVVGSMVTTTYRVRQAHSESGYARIVPPATTAEVLVTKSVGPDESKPVTSEEEQQLRSVVGLLSAAIEKVEESDISLGSLAEPLQKFKEACDNISSHEASTEVVNTPVVPDDGSPAWITEAQPANTQLVVSDVHASEELANAAAEAKAVEVIMAAYHESMSGINPKWLPDLNSLEGNPVERRFTVEIPWDFAAGSNQETDIQLPETAFKTYLRVRTDRTVRGMIYRQWKADTQHRRLETAGMVFGGLVAGAFVLAMFFGSDNRMNKRWRKTRFLAAAAAITGVVAVVGESSDTQLADFFSGTNPNASAAYGAEAADSEHGYTMARRGESAALQRRKASTSDLFGLPVQGSRVSIVLLGDESLSDTDLNRLRDGLVQCVEGFDGTPVKIVCSDEGGPRSFQAGGRNSRGNQHFKGLDELLSSSFSGKPRKSSIGSTLSAALSSRPDAVVMIRTADIPLHADGSRSPLRHLERLDSAVVVHGIDISDHTQTSQALEKVISRHDGQYVRVKHW